MGRAGAAVRSWTFGAKCPQSDRRGLPAANNCALLAPRQDRSRTIPAKPDRRPDRTRKALLGAFVELILERGYEAVTVDDVVERANIGRSTLYAHFGGLEGLLKQSLTGPSTLLAELAGGPVPRHALAALLDHFRDQRQRNKVFFTAPIRGLWVRRLAEMIEPRLAALAKVQARPAPALPWSFVAVQVAEGQIALVANWLSLRASTPPEVIAQALVVTTRATIDGLAPVVAAGLDRSDPF